jgi:hypothetical protein
MMLPPSVLPAGAPGADMFRRLWVHEVFRVFYDRLVDDKDREWLMGQVSGQSTKKKQLALICLACPLT